ncbi:MAG: hypothetical protein KA712_16230 [Myxococcales bacterium]|nr:hypothetical protein [Myxococcales bacterium]
MSRRKYAAGSLSRGGAALLLMLAAAPAQGQGPVNDCAAGDFLDRTVANAERSLTWGFSIQTNPERCMRVMVGQQVRWVGSFGAHPLDAEGGDLPNPIAQHDEGVVTFSTPGTFGYVCGFHPVMRGAIRVVAPVPAPVPALGRFGAAGLALAVCGVVAWQARKRRMPET